MTTTSMFERSPLDIIAADPDQAEADVAAYVAGFTGSRFETIAGRNTDPDTIGADDLVAVSTLGVHISAAAAIWLLEDGAAEVTSHLKAIPTDTDIWAAPPEVIGPGSPAWQLWYRLRELRWRDNPGEMGPTTTSKLLAAKRPRLLPVHDSRTAAALYPGTNGRFDFWAAWRTELAGRPAERDEVCGRLRSAAGEMPVSSLRLLDIAIWSYARRHRLGIRTSA